MSKNSFSPYKASHPFDDQKRQSINSKKQSSLNTPLRASVQKRNLNSPQIDPINYQAQINFLRKENEALIDEVEFWRGKFSQDDVDIRRDFQMNISEYAKENEILRNRLIQHEIQSKAASSSQYVIIDYKNRVDELESENQQQRLEIKKLLERVDEYEILIAKIRSNEENIKIYHTQLRDDNEHLKNLLYSRNMEQELTSKAQESFTKGQLDSLETNFMNQLSKLENQNQMLTIDLNDYKKNNQILTDQIFELQNKLQDQLQIEKQIQIQLDLAQVIIKKIINNERKGYNKWKSRERMNLMYQ